MEKVKFDGFINRYNLGGEIESVLIKSADKRLDVKMISDDKTLLGSVSLSEVEFPDGEFGIYTTSHLKAFLSVLDNNITIEHTPGALKFKDNRTKVQYMLAAASVIPGVPNLSKLPDFDATITLNDEFISTFIKSKSALPDADTFTFTCKDNSGEIILGYSTINSNRISISVDCDCPEDVAPIAFSAKYLKAILLSNKGSSNSFLKISTEGLAYLEFVDGDFKSTYYLVQVK